MGQIEFTFAQGGGAGKGALFVAEKLRFDELLGDGRAVDLDEGFVRPLRMGMNGPGYQFLTGPVLASNQDPSRSRCGDTDLFLEQSDRFAIADHLVFLGDACFQGAVFFHQLADSQGILYRKQQLFQGQGFFDEIIGAQLGRFHGGFNGAVTAHHDDQLIWGDLADLPQGFDPVNPRHPDVEQNQVRIFLPERAQSLFTALG